MRRSPWHTMLMALWIVAAPLRVTGCARLTAQASPQDRPVVRGVLFFSPTCPHCGEVIQGILPRIFASHGGEPTVVVDSTAAAGDRYLYLVTDGRLELLLVNVFVEGGARLYDAATVAFAIPADRGGVPRLVIGDAVLVGSYEVPAHLDTLIAHHAREGGLDWPAVPGLASLTAAFRSSAPPTVAEAGPSDRPPPREPRPTQPLADRRGASPEETGEPALTAPDTSTSVKFPSLPAGRPSVGAAFARDPTGNGLAVLVLVALGASLIAAPIARRARGPRGVPGW